MTHIINLTFAEENSNFDAVLDWLKNVGMPIAANSESGVTASRLLKIVEVPGDPEFLKEGRNISMQLEFDDMGKAHSWLEDYMGPLAEGYTDTFGRQPLCFATVLEEA